MINESHDEDFNHYYNLHYEHFYHLLRKIQNRIVYILIVILHHMSHQILCHSRF
jgi:hypothetical protein